MPMLGNKTNAKRARDDYAKSDDLNFDDELFFSDDGCSRAVYKIDGIIYKVDRYDGYSNKAEWNNYQRLTKKTLPPGFFLPKTRLIDVDGDQIIAMEYIEGLPMARCYCWESERHTENCMPEDVHDIVSNYIGDTGGNNVIRTENGEYYLIDIAS